MRFLALSLFLIGILGLFFPYIGYPLVLLAKRRRPARPLAPSHDRPSLSVIVAARNEAASIRGKIENLLDQGYPGTLEILIVSDASDDGMDEIAGEFAARDPRVRFVRCEERRGKTAAQNRALEFAAGNILVFTDASVTLAPGALTALADEFRDPTVGCVTGEDESRAADGSDPTAGAGFYTRFEILVRRLEMERTGTLIGVSGCLFAVRRFLRPAIPLETVDDFYMPLHVAARGFRVVAARDAVAYVRRSKGLRQEYSRKVRTFTGALFTFFAARKMENSDGLIRVRLHLFAHKMARWLGPVFAVFALAGNAALAGTHSFFTLLLALQVAGYALALAGIFGEFVGHGRLQPFHLASSFSIHLEKYFSKILRLASFFLLVQTAAAHAWFRWLTGRPFVTWTPTSRENPMSENNLAKTSGGD